MKNKYPFPKKSFLHWYLPKGEKNIYDQDGQVTHKFSLSAAKIKVRDGKLVNCKLQFI